jgi:outer membrane protein assembly factor BamA
VRDLGPGSFSGDGNFLNQTGDIKFDASLEFRSKLFWKIQSAVFIDAGNIWTIKKYKDQPDGEFRVDKFWKQIALSYGIGLRMDANFFIVRFDAGMKAIDPAYTGRAHYPITHHSFDRDFAFHFAVGLPF